MSGRGRGGRGLDEQEEEEEAVSERFYRTTLKRSNYAFFREAVDGFDHETTCHLALVMNCLQWFWRNTT